MSIALIQAQHKDFMTWTGVQVEGELFDLIDFEVSPEIRFTQNSTFFRSIHSDFDLSVPISKFLRLGGQYRVQQKNYMQDYSYLVNRLGIYGKLDYKIKRLRLDYRVLYQWEYVGINTREFGNIPYQEHRHKISARYYRKRWDLRPKASMEFFFLHKPDFVANEWKYRLSMGLSYKLTKDLDIDASYKLQNEFFETNPLTAHILALKLSYAL